MRFSTRDTSLRSLDVPLLVVTLAKGDALDDQLRGLDDTLGGALSRVIERRDFRAGRDETMHLVGGTKGPQRVLLVGLGGVTEHAGGDPASRHDRRAVRAPDGSARDRLVPWGRRA